MIAQVIQGSSVLPLGRVKPLVAAEGSAATTKVLGRGRTHRLQFVDIEFLSDHQLLLNSESLFSSTIAKEGTGRVKKPEWVAIDDTSAIEDRPVSHSMGEYIKLKVRIKFDAPRSMEIRADLFGLLNARIPYFIARDISFRGGSITSIEVTSEVPIPRKVRHVSFTISWILQGEHITSTGHGATHSVVAAPRQSKHEIFVTMGEPSTLPLLPGISIGRMRHAIERVSAAWNGNADPSPRDIVELLMEEFSNRFDLYDPVADPWELSNPTKNSDCINICEYVLSLLKMVGCEGAITPVLIYEKFVGPQSWGTPDTVIEVDDKGNKIVRPALILDRSKMAPDEGAYFLASEETASRGRKFGGLANPLICEMDPAIPPKPRFPIVFVTLSTDSFDKNSFEACLKFTHAGETVYFPGGISPRVDGKFAFTPLAVLQRTFRNLRWRGPTALDGELIKKYG